ncbi:MAG: hypothetical protein IAE78_20750 [Myxococcus sp.]|nr:hypothetical protein [Myxococcus sp.]
MDLLLLALLVALAVWTGRKLKRFVASRSAARHWRSTPGSSADNPIVLRSGKQMDQAIAAVRCQCGGRVLSLGETPRLGLRVARGRCVECERDVDLYFVMPNLVN